MYDDFHTYIQVSDNYIRNFAMIHESYYWKKELLKSAKKINKKIAVKKEWSESKYAKLEKDIMLGFYIVRKLMEASKLPNRIGTMKFSLKEFANNGENLTRLNRHTYYEYYNLDVPKIVKRDLKFLINLFVHSYIFSPIIDLADDKDLASMVDDKLSEEEKIEIYENGKKKLTGIFVNTDKLKNDFLYEIDIDSLIKAFEEIGKSQVTRAELIYNSSKRDFDIVQFDTENEISEELENKIKKLDKK